jgi:hypothetical protein
MFLQQGPKLFFECHLAISDHLALAISLSDKDSAASPSRAKKEEGFL